MTWVERNNGLIYKWWLGSSIAVADLVAVYQPLGASDLASSYTNLITPGVNDATAGVAPTWAKDTAWVFASSAYLTTPIVPESDWTIFVHCQAIAATTGIDSIIGQQAANANQYMTANLVFVSGNLAGTLNWQYAATSFGKGVAAGAATYRWSQALANNKAYLDGSLQATISSTFSGSPIAIYIGARNVAGTATDPLTGRILAVAIYNRELTAAEVLAVSNQAQNITEFDDPTPNINYIVQHPATKRLNSTSHELLIATDSGIYRTFNGGREWAKITLPNPSNTEFADSPAATVDELVFDWVAYDPLDSTILYVRATKASVSRMWIYKSTDDGLNWSSRGVVAT